MESVGWDYTIQMSGLSLHCYRGCTQLQKDSGEGSSVTSESPRAPCHGSRSSFHLTSCTEQRGFSNSPLSEMAFLSDLVGTLLIPP